MPTSPQTDGECQGAGELASFNTADRNMLEWNYGQYEGLRTAEIHAEPPAWQLFRDAVFRLRQVSESRMLPRQAPSRFTVSRDVDNGKFVFHCNTSEFPQTTVGWSPATQHG
jgi:hypothetical protein